jgi:hypothetical protein
MCCGDPAAVMKRKVFAWEPRWILNMVLVGACFWPLLLVALPMLVLYRQQMPVRVPLCEAHKNYWRSRHLFNYGGLAAFLVLGAILVVAWCTFSDVGASGARVSIWAEVLPYLTVGALLAGFVWLCIAVVLHSKTLLPMEISPRGITLINVSPRFIEAFPREPETSDMGPLPRKEWARSEWDSEAPPSSSTAERPPLEEGLQTRPGLVAPLPAWEQTDAPDLLPRRPRQSLVVKQTPAGLIVAGVLAGLFVMCAGGAALLWWANSLPPERPVPPAGAMRSAAPMAANNAPLAPPPAPILQPGGPFPVQLVLAPHEIRRFQGHTGCGHAVAYAPDSRTALSGSCDNTARLWDVETGRQLQCLQGFQSQVNGVAFAPDGRQALTVSNDGQVQLWDLLTGREVRRLIGHQGAVHGVCFAPDGRTALTAGEDHSVRQWDVQTGREVRRFEGHTGAVLSVAVSADGRRALSGGKDNLVRLWDMATGKELRRFAGHTNKVTSVGFSPDGRRAASSSGRTVRNENLVPVDSAVRLWDVETGRELRRLVGHTDAVACVAFSPEGRRLLSGGADNSLRLWDVESGRELLRLDGHDKWVFSVAFSPDGRRALSGGADQTVRLWDLPDMVAMPPAPGK